MATTFVLVDTEAGVLAADGFLRTLALEGLPGDRTAAWAALTGNRETLAWLIERAGTPAGVAVLEFGPADAGPRHAYLRCLFVAPAFRGQGLGDLARGFLQSVATAHGARLVTREGDPALHEQKLPDLMRRTPERGRHAHVQMRAA